MVIGACARGGVFRFHSAALRRRRKSVQIIRLKKLQVNEEGEGTFEANGIKMSVYILK